MSELPKSDLFHSAVPEVLQPVTVSEAACAHIRAELKRRGQGIGMRLGVKDSGCSGLAYVVDFVDEASSDDHAFNSDAGCTIYVAPESYPYVRGTYIDYVQDGLNYRFKFINPNESGSCGCGESFSV